MFEFSRSKVVTYLMRDFTRREQNCDKCDTSKSRAVHSIQWVGRIRVPKFSGKGWKMKIYLGPRKTEKRGVFIIFPLEKF